MLNSETNYLNSDVPGFSHPYIPTEQSNPFAYPRSNDAVVKSARILIVDDDRSIAELIRKHLELAGFINVEYVTEARKAIPKIHNWNPELVLLDLRMHPIDGLQILKQIKSNESTANTTVIIVTSDLEETATTTTLNLGATDFVHKPIRSGELAARCRNALSAKACRDVASARASRAESDLLTDSLTQIANRRAFDYELARRMTEWNRQRTPLGLAMVDLDHFKSVNDQYGHQYGDRVLQSVASTVVDATRTMDLVARYGGEELAVILPSTTFHEVREISERIRTAIEQRSITFGDQVLSVTASIGLANAMNGDDTQLLMHRADTALYAAKRNGRNRVYFNDGARCLPVATTGFGLATKENNTAIQPKSSPRIAIVDDELTTVLTAKRYLSDAGYREFIEITDATEAVSTIQAKRPQLVILDIHMPSISGLQILEKLQAVDSSLPVLICTSERKSEAKIDALNLGASDFLQKPLDQSELVARVRNTLIVKERMDDLSTSSHRLEHEVQVRTTELEASRREAIQCLARAAELRDDQTGHHVLRVGRYARIISEEIGFDEERAAWLELAAQLHDVGKIGIPDSILRKPGPLDKAEFAIMQSHCADGTRIIRDDREEAQGQIQSHTDLGMGIFDDCNSPIMRMAAVIANTHHEKWNGSGYPNGLAGADIPIEGRITAVADVFDALSTKRPYKRVFSLDESFAMIQEANGTHFDPEVVKAFLKQKKAIVAAFHDYPCQG